MRGWCQGRLCRRAAVDRPLTPVPQPNTTIQAIKTDTHDPARHLMVATPVLCPPSSELPMLAAGMSIGHDMAEPGTAAAPAGGAPFASIFVSAPDGLRLHVRSYGPRLASTLP